jgi:hypothetical protein
VQWQAVEGSEKLSKINWTNTGFRRVISGDTVEFAKRLKNIETN